VKLNITFFAMALAVLPAAGARAATDAADGTLLSSEPCPPNPVASYEDYWAETRRDLDEETLAAAEEGIAMPPVDDALLRTAIENPEEVTEHLAYAGFECREIRYASSGLVIAGYLWKPIDTIGKRLPLVIVNRGGNSDFGPMTAWRHWGWHDFLRAGYVVLASQYRGGPGSEGQDEYGGGDLDDVRALIPLAGSLGYVDTDNVFAFGGSRGGMMTYMLARGDSPLRAFAIRAGLADLSQAVEDRPAMGSHVFARLMPDYADTEIALARRSATRWAHEITVPGILFHGSDDWRADAQGSLQVAEGMMRAGTQVELHLYAGDTHSMTLNRTDMMRHAIRFFDRYRVAARPTPPTRK